MGLDPGFVESYRFFRGYGANAHDAMLLATNERVLLSLCDSDEYRIEWEDDSEFDVSWASEDDQKQYLKELQSGELLCQGVTLQKRDGDSWVTVDSCWGIFLYVREEGAEARYHQAAILNPFAQQG